MINNIIASVNIAVSTMADAQRGVDAAFDPTSITAAKNAIDEAAFAAQQMADELGKIQEPQISEPIVDNIPPVKVPIEWQTDNLEVFIGSGFERFRQEAESTNILLHQLSDTQNNIAANSQQTSLFPPTMTADLTNMHSRIMAIGQKIKAIEADPLNLGYDKTNAELEQLRSQLSQAVSIQETLNTAVENMDIEGANQAYLQLSQTVGYTERYIRDNTDEQRLFNQAIQKGGVEANKLEGLVKKAVGAFAGLATLKKVFGFAQDCMSTFDTQLNSEIQLLGVLSNTARSAVSGADNSIDLDITANTSNVEAAFDTITAKAAEIQDRGIYGDEAMIAAGAEFSTYFKDTGAVEMMMDTLSDYAMGMSGGGAIDKTAMVDYATGLGKIMTGSYDAMTKKGFEFTDAQKAIIEGTASQAQIVEAIGEEYVGMSQDMQAAAAISSVIGESWDGLYEKMSNTPQGKIQQLTNKWGDLEEMIGNQLYPHVVEIVDFVNENWGTIESIISAASAGIGVLIDIIGWLVQQALMFAQVIIDNWSSIAPVVQFVAGAVLALVAAYAAYKIATGIATAAQVAMNGALYACPIVWIVGLIIIFIVAIYAAVGAMNKFAGTSISATGVVAGVFATLGAHLLNMFIIPLQNKFAMFANFIGNLFNDPVAAVKVLFFDMCLTVLGYIKNIAHGIEDLINSIPGMSVDITGGLDNLYAGIEEAQQKVKDESEWKEYVEKWDYIDYGDAFEAGYSFGEGIDDSIANFDPSSIFDQNNYTQGFGGIGGSLEDIAGDTSDIKDSLDISGEDLKYLRDIAEQETVNRFTTAEVHIDMSGMQNTVSGKMDLDGFVEELTDAVDEAVEIITEGVHA